MKEARKRTQVCPQRQGSLRATVFLVACLLCGGVIGSLRGQTVHASVWSSSLDHSLESALVFQSQSSNQTEATVRVYDEILAQQILHIGIEAPSKTATAQADRNAAPSMDQEADTVIVNPLKAGAVNITSASGDNIDFLLITQLSHTVKPLANRLAADVIGSHDIESLAFRNPDGTYVLFTVNHHDSPVSLRTVWKDRLFTFTQAGNSIAVFAWNPTSQLVSLVAPEKLTSPDNTIFLEARCLQASALGIDLRCMSSSGSCSIFPVYFTCDSRRSAVPLTVTLSPADTSDIGDRRPVAVTITAAPEVGEHTLLQISPEHPGR